MEFVALGLSQPLLRALRDAEYVTATPIQAQAIPLVLAGRDVLGCAQTGTGKTAAFALPILQRLSQQEPQGRRRTRCLVLCPTRELAVQIQDSFRTYGKHLTHKSAAVFGGVGQGPQVSALRQGAPIIVATPGRLMDLMQQGHADLAGVETLVLDEADRMLDMGFIPDIRRIVAALPKKRQTLLFSATMPPAIRSLASSLLSNPASVQVAAPAATADRVNQSVYLVPRAQKTALLVKLMDELKMQRVIVFTRTKHGADRVAKQVYRMGIRAEAIHGDKSQNARQNALENFRNNRTPLLIATDIASRGIDVDGITHVVNYDMTHEPETYIHRIGRTARAGAEGAAVSFCDKDELSRLRAVEKLIGVRVPVMTLPMLPPMAPMSPSELREAKAEAGPRRQPRQYNASARPANRNGQRPAHPMASGSGNRAAGNTPTPRWDMTGNTPESGLRPRRRRRRALAAKA